MTLISEKLSQALELLGTEGENWVKGKEEMIQEASGANLSVFDAKPGNRTATSIYQHRRSVFQKAIEAARKDND